MNQKRNILMPQDPLNSKKKVLQKYLLPLQLFLGITCFSLAVIFLFAGAKYSFRIQAVMTLTIVFISYLSQQRSIKASFKQSSIHLILTSLFFGNFATILLTGGILSPVIWSYAYIPLIALYFSSIRNACIACIAVAVGASITFAWQYYFRLPLNELAGPFPLGIHFYCMVSSFVLMSFTSVIESRHRRIDFEQHLDHLKNLQAGQRDQALENMAGGIAHEINNPLTIIQGSLKVIKRVIDSFEEDPATLKINKQIKTINKTLNRISTTTKSLSLLSDGTGDEKAIVSIESIFEHIEAMTKKKLQDHQVHFSLSLPTQIGQLDLHVSRGQIIQAIFNIINNSLDALENISLKEIAVAITDGPNTINIEINDSGPGISSSISEDIFLPFFTTKKIGSGAGLGLSLSRRLIENNRGTITLLKNRKGFIITLPKYEEELANYHQTKSA